MWCDVYYGYLFYFFFFQAEDGIRDAQESRGLGDVYKRQHPDAVGWDWIGMNLHDGGALTAFRLRRADGSTLWLSLIHI